MTYLKDISNNNNVPVKAVSITGHLKTRYQLQQSFSIKYGRKMPFGKFDRAAVHAIVAYFRIYPDSFINWLRKSTKSSQKCPRSG
jgi:hypothetical protein